NLIYLHSFPTRRSSDLYQQLKIQRMRRQLLMRDELFRLIGENAADMIAVVDSKGNRLYNSPSYERILGYTSEELKQTSAFEQIRSEEHTSELQSRENLV